MNYLLFVVFPYACLAIFLIGSIYRYKNRAFSVSSLSSQFLEGKNLFLASREVIPGLGLEGEVLAGVRAAKLVQESLKKTDPLKRSGAA